MRVPLLPITLDARGAFSRDLLSVRKLANGIELNRSEVAAVPDTLLFEVGGCVKLSDWGVLLWPAERDAIYGEGLMRPLLNGVQFSRGFCRQVARPTGLLRQIDRVRRLNMRLDDLALCIDQGGQNGTHNLNGLDFKKLQGKPIQGSTHEFDIWSDLDRRGFGHYEDDLFVVDRVDDHL